MRSITALSFVFSGMVLQHAHAVSHSAWHYAAAAGLFALGHGVLAMYWNDASQPQAK